MNDPIGDVDDAPRSAAPVMTYIRYAGLAAGLIGSVVVFPIAVVLQMSDAEFRRIAMAHLPLFLGVPAAVMSAFCIVLLFRTAEGQIRFEVLGLKVEGASGPILMWALCFLVIVLAIRVLWVLP